MSRKKPNTPVSKPGTGAITDKAEDARSEARDNMEYLRNYFYAANEATQREATPYEDKIKEQLKTALNEGLNNYIKKQPMTPDESFPMFKAFEEGTGKGIMSQIDADKKSIYDKNITMAKNSVYGHKDNVLDQYYAAEAAGIRTTIKSSDSESHRITLPNYNGNENIKIANNPVGGFVDAFEDPFAPLRDDPMEDEEPKAVKADDDFFAKMSNQADRIMADARNKAKLEEVKKDNPWYANTNYTFTYGNKPAKEKKPIVKATPSPRIKLDINMITRCMTTEDNHELMFVSCPKDTVLSDAEILEKARSGRDNLYHFLEGLPQSNKKQKKQPVKKVAVPRQNNRLNVTEFASKTNHLFDKLSSFDVYRSLCNRQVNGNQFRASFTATACMKNVMVSDLTNNNFFGATTGKVVNEHAELLSIDVSPGGGSYTTKTSFKRVMIPLANISPIGQYYFSRFFRFKIASTEASVKAFGGKTAKQKLKGLIVASEYINYDGKKETMDGEIDAFVITDVVSGNAHRFAASDIEIYALNSKYLQLSQKSIDRKIEKGKSVIITDDRRIGLNKGDIVKVISVSKSASNTKNSIVVVQDDKKQKHSILLKQAKVYVKD